MTPRHAMVLTRLVSVVPLVVAAGAMWWWSAEVDRELAAIAAAERDQQVIAHRIERALGPDLDLLKRKRDVEAVEIVVRAVAEDADLGNAAARLGLVGSVEVRP